MGGRAGAAITVVIPVWGAAYRGALPAALASVPEGAKVIVVLGAGEPDPPGGVGAEVELIRAEAPLTVGAARNLGLASVETPYVVFLDADDQLVPEAQGTMLAALESDPGAVLATTQAIDRESGDVVAPRSFVGSLARSPSALAAAESVWSLLPTQGCAVIRTEAAKACGGYADSDGGEDWAFGIALVRRGRVVVLPDPGLIYAPAGFRDGKLSRRELSGRAALARASWRRSGGVGSLLLLPLIGALQFVVIGVLRPLRTRGAGK